MTHRGLRPLGTTPSRHRAAARRDPRQRRLAAAFVLGLFALPFSCSRSAPPPEEQSQREAVEVVTTTPMIAELPRFVRATGTLHGDEEATISSKVSGRVVQVARDLGDRAGPGEVLLRIDPTDYELALREREQAFKEVLASVGLEALPEESFDVNALPAVVRARLQAENARARYERGKVLAEREPPLISAQDFADLRTAWEVAESNLGVERLGAEAKIAEARTLLAQVRVAEQRVADCIIRAPGSDLPERAYDVAARMVSEGDFVQVAAPLFRLVDSSPLKLRAPIPERRAGDVIRDQPAIVSVEQRPEPFTGTVSRVSPAIDPVTRHFMVEIRIPNESRALKAGAFGVAQILVRREPALVVPEGAVVTFAGVHKVVSVQDGKAVEKRVELGQRHEGNVEILSGVTEKDVIVARPTGSLTTGVAVRATPQAPPEAPR